MKLLKARTYVLIILISTIPLLFIFNLFSQQHPKYPQAKKGILDLSNWDLKNHGVVGLDGEWEFYWNKLLTYEDFNGVKKIEPDGYLKVPSVWTNYTLNGNDLPGKGYATYRLKVKTNDIDSIKGLKILNQSTAYRLMINDQVIAENGHVGNTKETTIPEYRPQTVSFQNNSKDFEIIVQVSNYVYSRGGIWYSIYFGNDQQIRQLKEIISGKQMFMFGVVMIMSLYYIGIFLLQKRNKSAIYFALLLLIEGIRILVTGEYLIKNLIPSANIFWMVPIEYITMVIGHVVWMLFVFELYPKEMSHKIVKIISYTGVSISMFIVLTPIYTFTKYLIFYELYIMYIYLYTIFVILKAVLKKRENADLLFLGTILFISVFIIDVLYHWNVIYNQYGTNFEITGYIFIFIQSYILSAKFSLAFENEEKLSKKLISLDKLKDEFLANTSHELRTPLNGIINITESLLKGLTGKLNLRQEENLQAILASSRRLYNLINDILDISSLRLNEVKISPKSLNVRMIVDSVIFVLEHLKGEKDIVFENLVSEDTPLVFFDEERLGQVLYNLLGNALKFTEEGSIKVSTKFSNNIVTIFVEDTGIGILEENLDNIFNYFEQVDASINRKYEGIGIGLNITKKLIELHGGTINVKSQFGKGTCFFFTLHVTQGKSENNIHKVEPVFQINNVKIDEINIEHKHDRYNILVVEDDVVNLKAVINNLHLYGYTVKAVQNANDALELLDNGINFDMVILDVMMPDISGYDVLKKIREKYLAIELPVLLLTALSRISDISIGFKLGANDYLIKPFEPEELNARVKSLVNMRNAIDSLVTTELEFLQAQIKPHFIYNALSIIASLSIREPEKSRELILNLSDYLRSSFDFEKREGLTTLKKELELVEAYLSIEQARFKERICINFQIDSKDCILPMLSIQPLVENAVRHGIMPLIKGGIISIITEDRNGYVRISVKDNGVGIDEEKIQNILSGELKKGSVGIRNINRRLIVLYGKGINVTKCEEGGTKVEFIIPYKQNGGD
jgi:signal transduction histidine kinase